QPALPPTLREVPCSSRPGRGRDARDLGRPPDSTNLLHEVGHAAANPRSCPGSAAASSPRCQDSPLSRAMHLRVGVCLVARITTSDPGSTCRAHGSERMLFPAVKLQ